MRRLTPEHLGPLKAPSMIQSPVFAGNSCIPLSPSPVIIPSLPSILVVAEQRVLRPKELQSTPEEADKIISALFSFGRSCIVPIDLLSRMRLLFDGCPFGVINVCFEEWAQRLPSQKLVCRILLSASAMRIRPRGGCLLACQRVLADLLTRNGLTCSSPAVINFLRLDPHRDRETLALYTTRFFLRLKKFLYTLAVVYGVKSPAYSLADVPFTRNFHPIMDAHPVLSYDLSPDAVRAMSTAESLPIQASIGKGSLPVIREDVAETHTLVTSESSELSDVSEEVIILPQPTSAPVDVIDLVSSSDSDPEEPADKRMRRSEAGTVPRNIYQHSEDFDDDDEMGELVDDSDSDDDDEPAVQHNPRAQSNTSEPSAAWQGFLANPGILAALKVATSQNNVNVRSLRKMSNDFIVQQTSGDSGLPVKPHAEDPVAMAAAGNIRSGTFPLPDGSSDINVEAVRKMHLKHCKLCADPDFEHMCYIEPLLLTVTHGYDPSVEYDVIPITPYRGNGASVREFPEATDKAMQKLISRGYVRRATEEERDSYHPVAIHAVIKNSDVHRARAATGVHITDAGSFNEANRQLANLGLKLVTARPVFNYKANGVNAALRKFPFRQPGIMEATAVMIKDGYGIITDFEAYFNQFVLAAEFRKYTLFEYKGEWWVSERLLFGVSTAPHYGFMWAAEFHAYFVSQGIRHTVMQDDHLACAPDYASALSTQEHILDTFHECGFRTSPDKAQLGQVFSYIGFRIDTRSMTMTILSESARSFLKRLEALEAFLFLSASPPTLEEITSLTGCMVNYSQLLQRGMTHIYWMYRFQATHPSCPPAVHDRLGAACAYFFLLWSRGHVKNQRVWSFLYSTKKPSRQILSLSFVFRLMRQVFRIMGTAASLASFILLIHMHGQYVGQLATASVVVKRPCLTDRN